MSDRPPSVGPLLRAAAPDQLPEALADHLRRQHLADQVEVLLGDYTLTGLWPLLADAAPTAGTLAARCFGSQQPVVDGGSDGTRVHLPLSVWGERLGVLVVRTARAPEAELTEHLTSAADELAVALRAADRYTDRPVRRQVRWPPSTPRRPPRAAGEQRGGCQGPVSLRAAFGTVSHSQ